MWMDEVLHGDGPTKPVIGEPAVDREVCMFLAPSLGLDDSVNPDVYVELGLEPYQAAGADTPPASPLVGTTSREGLEFAAAMSASKIRAVRPEATPSAAQQDAHIDVHCVKCCTTIGAGQDAAAVRVCLAAHLAEHKARLRGARGGH